MIGKLVMKPAIDLKPHPVHLERKLIELICRKVRIRRTGKLQIYMGSDPAHLIAVIIHGITLVHQSFHQRRKFILIYKGQTVLSGSVKRRAHKEEDQESFHKQFHKFGCKDNLFD
jgi:hypothetical protein